MASSCAAILKTGKNKGSQCPNKAKPGSTFCGVHNKGTTLSLSTEKVPSTKKPVTKKAIAATTTKTDYKKLMKLLPQKKIGPELIKLDDGINLITFLLNKEGPFTIDTGIVEHNIFLDKDDYEELMEEELTDEITIGEQGKKINIKDVEKLFKHINKLFEFIAESKGSGRSYFYEGHEEYDDSSAYLAWGS